MTDRDLWPADLVARILAHERAVGRRQEAAYGSDRRTRGLCERIDRLAADVRQARLALEAEMRDD